MGFCGWLPFARQVEETLEAVDGSSTSTYGEKQSRLLDFFNDTIAHPESSPADAVSDLSILSTPVLLSHGTDDPWVSVELGRQAFHAVRQVMDNVEWREFTGAENDGHWIKEPKGFDCAVQFFEKCSQS